MMKLLSSPLIAVVSAAFILPSPVCAEEARPQSLSVKVQEVGSRRKDKARYHYDHHHYNKDIERSRNLNIQITNFGGKPAPDLKVGIYWFTRKSSKLNLFKKEDIDVTLNGISEILEIESPTMTENTQRWGTYSTEIREGDQLAGYAVQLIYKGHAYPIVTSTGANSIRSQSDLDEIIKRSEAKKPSRKGGRD